MSKISFLKDIPSPVYYLLGGYLIYTSLKNKDDKEEKSQPDKKTVETAQDELTKAEQKQPATITATQAGIYADKLQAAMFDVGTNEKAIYDVFLDLKNDADLLLLFTKFGNRKKFEFGLPSFTGNLARWFETELDQKEVETINYILKQKKIKYRF